MISFDEAVGIIRRIDVPRVTEEVSIADAAGRVLADPVIARIDSPRSDVSAMDGFAVRDGDLDEVPVTLQVVGASYAGAGWQQEMTPGTCVRIFTGAPVPAGADRVVVQEDVRSTAEVALFESRAGSARHIRKAGSDFAVGDQLLPRGRLLDPRAMVAAAGADTGALNVYRRPRLRILSTGDELAKPGTAQGRRDAIPESVSFGIAALAMTKGANSIGTTSLRDDLSAMQQVARESVEDADLIVVTGGASVGEKDFAKAMFEPLGLELLFSKVAMKPGKPVWLGRAGGCLIMGLPGNPTSAMVTARLFLAPLLAVLTGRAADEEWRWRSTRLAAPLAGCGDRETFYRARIKGDGAEILSFQDSSAQLALADADLLVRQRANTAAAMAGEQVEVLDF